MNDLIRRQEAIDALDCINGVEEVLRSIPSVQPEIIRCKDCKEFRRWIDTDITFCDLTESERDALDFCSRAERRQGEGN